MYLLLRARSTSRPVSDVVRVEHVRHAFVRNGSGRLRDSDSLQVKTLGRPQRQFGPVAMACRNDVPPGAATAQPGMHTRAGAMSVRSGIHRLQPAAHSSAPANACRAKRRTHALGSIFLVAVCAAVTLLSSNAVSSAALDNEQTLVDKANDTLTVQQWNTVFNSVAPLDRNQLTHEWFQSGRVAYTVTGPHAASFSGNLEIGYQVTFAWALGVGIRFAYTTPNLFLNGDNINPFSSTFNPLRSTISSNLVPSVAIRSDLGNGPGVQEVATFSAPVSGSSGAIDIANAHGTLSGAADGVLIRPYARLTGSNANDTVSTYGDTWDMD